MSKITPPKWAESSKVESLKTRAKELVATTKEKAGPALSRVVDGIGAPAQNKMASANDLMAGSVNSLLAGLEGMADLVRRGRRRVQAAPLGRGVGLRPGIGPGLRIEGHRLPVRHRVGAGGGGLLRLVHAAPFGIGCAQLAPPAPRRP